MRGVWGGAPANAQSPDWSPVPKRRTPSFRLYPHPAAIAGLVLALRQIDPALARLYETEYPAHADEDPVYPDTAVGSSAEGSQHRPTEPGPAWLDDRLQQARLDTAKRLAQIADYAPSAPMAAHAVALANRMHRCCDSILVLRSVPHAPRQRILPLVATCDSRHCPPCSVRLSVSRAMDVATAIAPAVAQGRCTHAVLTVPNCQPGQLRQTLTRLAKAWRALRGGAGGASKAPGPWRNVRGGIWRIEISWNSTSETWHPHIHTLLDAPWMDPRAARDAWRDASARQGFYAKTWRVSLQAVGRNGQAPSAAAAELSKYALKPLSLDIARAEPWLELLAALKGKRLIDSWGSLSLPPQQRRAPTAWELLGGLDRILAGPHTPDRARTVAAVAQNTTVMRVALRHHPWFHLIPYTED